MPDYSMPEYWQSRFQEESHFEWLGSGDTILPHVTRALSLSPRREDDTCRPTNHGTSTPTPTKVLHIGSGTSSLSLSLRTLVSARIINIDFIQSCLTRLRQFELDAFGDIKMDYERLDILDWEQVETRLRQPEGERVVLIIDKSTSDAISCGPDIPSPFSLSLISPMRILELHLAALSAPGSTWLAFSYSTSRFDGIGELWRVEHTEKVPTESGQTKEGVCTPEIWNTLYVLRRTSVSVPSLVQQ